jgi:YkoY family integral membrane protein
VLPDFASLNIELGDLAIIGALVVLEGLLSADNALVMAVMVLSLPRHLQQKALRYGLLGAFAFRIAATLLATLLIQVAFVKLAGGLYLLYLTASHFWGSHGRTDRKAPPAAKPAFGLSAFWATVVRVELVNLAFSIDSILVAVAMSPKVWVVLTGGILGIVAMRIVAGQLIELIRRYPSLVDGAFVIIAWIGVKLILDWAHKMTWISWEIPQVASLSVIVLVFVAYYVHARRQAAGVAGPPDASGPPPPVH